MLIVSWCWGIVYPWGGGAKERAGLRWALHVLLWAGVVAGLWWLNRWGGVERILRSPWPVLHQCWLPLLAVSVYGLVWLGRGLWLSLERDRWPGLAPEIEDAWSETRSALASANIDLQTTPVFLVLGPLTGELRTLFASLGTAQLPSRFNASFQVFACQEGVFVVYEQTTPDRLRHLGQMLVHQRGSTMPIQGIVRIVPFGARMVNEVREELRIIRESTGTDVPVYVAVSGADVMIGADWFQPFPPLPDLDPAEVAAMYRDGIDWLCLERMPADVRGQFRLDLAPTEAGKLPQALRENIRLYQSLRTIQAWRGPLIELLTHGTQNEFSEPGMVAGCYFLPRGESKTLAGVLWCDLLAYQRTPILTPDALRHNESIRRQAWLGYTVGIVGVLACAAAALGSILLGRL